MEDKEKSKSNIFDALKTTSFDVENKQHNDKKDKFLEDLKNDENAPCRYNIVVYKNKDTNFQCVSIILLTIFRYSATQTIEIVARLLSEEKAILGTFFYEIAEQRLFEITASCTRLGHELEVLIEEEKK